MDKSKRFSQEVKERAVRLVLEKQREYPSQWSAISSVAEKIGCSPESLRRWIRRKEIDLGKRDGITSEERARIKQLERENQELKRANEIFVKQRLFSPRRSSAAYRSDGGLY